MKYLIIDASLNGTGIRDYYNGGYINPNELNINSTIVKQLSEWLDKYADAHYNGFTDNEGIDKLDQEGKKIALTIKKELKDTKIEYYSDARLLRYEIE